VQSVARDTTARRETEAALRRSNELQTMLLRELNHRVKNTLGGLISLIDVQANAADTVRDFANELISRLRSVLSIHSMLSESEWSKLELRSIIESLVPNELGDRLVLEGPRTDVRAEIATPLGMVLQELISNAIKYGAWSNGQGTVTIRWRDTQEAATELEWIETGGPSLDPNPSPSLGSRLVEGFTRFELRGTARLTFPAAGAHHTLRISIKEPLDNYSSASQQSPDSVPTASSTTSA